VLSLEIQFVHTDSTDIACDSAKCHESNFTILGLIRISAIGKPVPFTFYTMHILCLASSCLGMKYLPAVVVILVV